MANPASIRLGTTGKAQVKADLIEIADTGDAQAKRWARSYENAGRDVQAAMERQKNAAAKISAIMPQTAVQMRINDTNSTGFGQFEGSARQSAAAIAALIAQEEQLAARTRALVSAIDPAYAAQERFNREIAEARTLVSAGALSLDQYVAKLGVEQRALDQVTLAHKRGVASSGQLRAGTQQLSYQISDVSASLGSGTSITQVFAQQIGQTVQLMTGATTGFVGFLAGPWGAALTGGVILLTMLASKYMDNKDAAEKAESAMKKFQDRQSDIGKFIDETTGKLKEQNLTLIRNAALTRAARIDENNKAIKDGSQNAFVKAREALGSTTPIYTAGGVITPKVDPALRKAIQDAGSDVVKLDANLQALGRKRPDLKTVIADISNLAGQAVVASQENKQLALEVRALNGDTTALAKADTSLIDARAKLAGATNNMDRAQARYTISIREADNAFNASKKTAKDQEQLLAARTSAEHALNVAQDANKKGGDAHAKSLARNASAMEVNASAALDLAKAYLIGGDAALRAEAMRKGATDATRKGIDVEAQVRRQLDIMIGDQVATGAKSVAQLREETEARAAVRAQILGNVIPTSGMNQALSDEAALRPLLKLQTLAQGDALTVLTQVIKDYRAALADAHAEESKSGAIKAITDAKDRIEEIRSSITDLARNPLDQVLNTANRSAVREADDKKYTGEYRKEFIDTKILEARAGFEADRAKYIIDSVRGQQDSITLAERELQLVGANDNLRSAEIDKLNMILDLRRRGIDPLSEEGRLLLGNQEKLSLLGASIAKSEAAISELRDFGSSALDTLFSTNAADSWGDRVKSIVGDLKGELMKLVLLNPLKNLLNGNSKLPTLSTAIGSIGKLFGGTAAAPTRTTGPPGFAIGTEYASGGAAIVGEFGKELVDLPRGSRVTPAAETRRMLAGNDNVRSGPTIIVNANDAVLADTVRGWVAQGVDIGAMRGAAGGAAISAAEARASGARKLGRRW